MEKESNNFQHPDEVLIKYLAGSATEEERDYARKWINESLNNKRYFDGLKDYYQLSKVVQKPSGYDKEAGWNRVKAGYYKTRYQNELKEKIKYRRKVIWRVGLSSAAVVLIAVGIGYYYIGYSVSKQTITSQIFNEIIVPIGAKSHIILSDSTKVWLNAGSKLRYPENLLTGNREVYLEGEAFFDVTKVEKKQFIVKTAGLNIKVFGTQFNVKSYPDENQIQTTLVKGSIAIEPATGYTIIKPIYLKPNQTATYYKSSSHIERSTKDDIKKEQETEARQISKVVINPEINPLPITSWKDNEWVFDGEELGELAVKLERRYNVKITFENNNLISYKFSGTITDETFEQVLKIIQLSAPITFTVDGNKVVLKEDPLYKKKYDKMINNPKNQNL